MRDWLARLRDWFRLDQLQQDVRYALRGLRRSPGFAAAVVLTLGLGIGANASMFGIVDRLMFRPLAYLRDPDTVHRVYWQWQQNGVTTTRLSTQYARFLDLGRWTTSFSSLAGFHETDLARAGRAAASDPRARGGHGAKFACVGIVLGMLLAGAASRALEPLLFRQSATDPRVYGGVAATMLVAAFVACLLPAVWAARIDPTTALRSE